MRKRTDETSETKKQREGATVKRTERRMLLNGADCVSVWTGREGRGRESEGERRERHREIERGEQRDWQVQHSAGDRKRATASEHRERRERAGLQQKKKVQKQRQAQAGDSVHRPADNVERGEDDERRRIKRQTRRQRFREELYEREMQRLRDPA